MGELDGKVAIVTGAGRGIGRAEALRLAEDGAAVVVNDFGGSLVGEGADRTPAEAVASEIREKGGRAVANAGDVSSWEDGKALVAQAVETFGRLDVLVNNAGIARPKMIFNMTEEDWDTVTRIHLKGSFVPTRFAAVHWREEVKRTGAPAGGSVIFTTSGNGLNGVPGHINYVAAKAGIAGMTTTLAKELAPYGVRVNAIAPLAFTRMTEELHGGPLFSDERRETLAPENVAEVVGWLAGPRSGDLTGQVVGFSGARLQAYRGWTPIGQAEVASVWSYDALDEQRDALFGS
jgi:NAD(P)-dependent dehydrogenase (short-subunit alcohol dehydrogenase family)